MSYGLLFLLMRFTEYELYVKAYATCWERYKKYKIQDLFSSDFQVPVISTLPFFYNKNPDIWIIKCEKMKCTIFRLYLK